MTGSWGSHGTTPYLDPPFAALAHRGFSLDGLENSMAAFRAAYDLGFRYVETDAHATSDGVAVALHDASLDRTTDAHGRVRELPWATVREARIGGTEPVPLLEDVLGTWPDLRVNIDVKVDGSESAVVDAIERTSAHERVCVTSFSGRRRRRTLAGLSQPVATSAGQGEVATFVLAARLRALGRPLVGRALHAVDCLQVPERSVSLTVVDARTVRAAHAARRAVHVWTVDDPADMERLIDLGVDGIVTNRADLLRDVLRARGLWS